LIEPNPPAIISGLPQSIALTSCIGLIGITSVNVYHLRTRPVRSKLLVVLGIILLIALGSFSIYALFYKNVLPQPLAVLAGLFIIWKLVIWSGLRIDVRIDL